MLRIRADHYVQFRKDNARELIADVRLQPILRKQAKGTEKAAKHADESIASLHALDGRVGIGEDVDISIADDAVNKRQCGRAEVTVLLRGEHANSEHSGDNDQSFAHSSAPE